MSAPSWIPRSRRNQRHRRNTNGIDLFDFDEFLVIIHNQDWENNPPKNRATQVFQNENISGKGGSRHTSHFVPASSSQQKERPPERLTISQQQLSSSFAIYHATISLSETLLSLRILILPLPFLTSLRLFLIYSQVIYSEQPLTFPELRKICQLLKL